MKCSDKKHFHYFHPLNFNNMLLSMTGFGRATQTIGEKTISVEIRSLNSKYTDLRFKLPNNYKEKEPILRKMIADRSERGKVDVNLEVKSVRGDDEYAINLPLFRKYVLELSALAKELGVEKGDLMQTVVRIPNVIAAGDEGIDEEEWKTVQATVTEALDRFEDFRLTEGAAMEKDLRMRIETIASLLEKVDPFEKERIQRLRQRMRQHLEEFLNKENVDENRFEQEVVFYIEKIDITEEKVRLEQHCKFFIEQLELTNKTTKGRKLSFISQEIGREINTLGAKAYSSDIQRIVVAMKDELEKIKEQVANSV
jgi:uncharacterized protein (TIGR00255 family)